MNHRITALLAASFLFSTAHAGTITVDGDLKDWIAKPAGKAGDWNRLLRPSRTLSAIEDQNTNYLDPGYGGQAYDAEALYLEIEEGTLYVAVVTGLHPTQTDWRPGDIAIDFGNDHRYEYGMVTVGDAVDGADAYGAGIGIAGQIYKVDAWNLGLWQGSGQIASGSTVSSYQRAHPTSIKAGQLLGSGVLSYAADGAKYNGLPIANLGNLGGKHYLIEAAIPLNLFEEFHNGLAAEKGFTVHWTMGCANDWIALDPQIAEAPEPASLGLMATGLVGMLGSRRRRRRT